MPVNPADDIHTRCLDGVADEIRALVADFGSEHPPGKIHGVYVRALPTDEKDFPLIFLTIEDESEEFGPGSFSTVEVTWPIRGFIMDKWSGDEKSMKWYRKWRHDILLHFSSHSRLASVPEIEDFVLRSAPILDASLVTQYKHMVSSFWIGCKTSEPRKKRGR